MTANELANYLENDFQIQEAVIDTLRQQQTEIESLLKFIDERGETGQLIMWKAQNELNCK
jgi:hypothetical protein